MTARSRVTTHSAHHLGAHRNFWWNADFLQLMASRWSYVPSNGRLLDVGCGQGAWSRTLTPYLPQVREVVGVDREERWVNEAGQSVTSETGPSYRYMTALADALPFPDAHFEVATCQTVLIHMSDPQAVINEMLRVLAPGGLLLLVEPCNRATQVTQKSWTYDEHPDLTIERFDFYLRCEEGKRRLGEGDNSLGDRLPSLLLGQEVHKLRVDLSDKTFSLWPPYEGQSQRTWHDQQARWADQDVWVWPEEKSQRYFTAGGGDPESFPERWSTRMSEQDKLSQALRDGTFVAGGGCLMYLLSAQKMG